MGKSKAPRKPFLVALIVSLILGCIATITVSVMPGQPQAKASPTPTPSPSEATFNDYWNESRKPPRLSPNAPCKPLHFGFDGNPRKFESDTAGRYRVPKGRTWHITNASLMMERYDGIGAQAGEWTGVLGGVHDGPWVGTAHGPNQGRWFTIAQSSLDNGSGIALQGQTPVNAVLDQGDWLAFVVWLRPGTHPGNYYFTLGASGTDCPA